MSRKVSKRDLRMLKEFVSKVMPYKKLGYMKKVMVIR